MSLRNEIEDRKTLNGNREERLCWLFYEKINNLLKTLLLSFLPRKVLLPCIQVGVKASIYTSEPDVKAKTITLEIPISPTRK